MTQVLHGKVALLVAATVSVCAAAFVSHSGSSRLHELDVMAGDQQLSQDDCLYVLSHRHGRVRISPTLAGLAAGPVVEGPYAYQDAKLICERQGPALRFE
jgi:hypothetical protein